MSSVNKVIIVGNLGSDPEKRLLPSGGAVTSLRVATSEARKNKATGESIEHTEWHRVVLFDRLGEVAAQYLSKGSQVYIEGRLKTRKWQAQDGTDRYTTEIVVSDMQFIGGRRTVQQEQEFVPAQKKESASTYQPTDDEDIPF